MNRSSTIPSHLVTRREAIKTTLLFSTSLLATPFLRHLYAKPPLANYPADGLHFLAVGDFGSGNEHQRSVARQMEAFAQKLNRPLTSVLALGDNFYGRLRPERFERHFEQMYQQEILRETLI